MTSKIKITYNNNLQSLNYINICLLNSEKIISVCSSTFTIGV
jgi:hypothetical protein